VSVPVPAQPFLRRVVRSGLGSLHTFLICFSAAVRGVPTLIDPRPLMMEESGLYSHAYEVQIK
jgi:hypothetical protein